MNNHGSKAEYDQHSKRASPQRTDTKQGVSSAAADQAASYSQHSQQPQQQQQQQSKQHKWSRHQSHQQLPMPAQVQTGPLAGSSAQAAAGKSYSSSATKQRMDRGFITVTATTQHPSPQQQHHHHHHHHLSHQQQQQLPAAPQQQQQQQQASVPAQSFVLQPMQQGPMQQQGPMPQGYPAPLAAVPQLQVQDSPSSLLLPPPSATTTTSPQQQQQQPPPLQALPPDLDQERCKRLAEVLLKCGKPADASAWAQAALSSDPWNVELLLLRGRALEAAGNIPGEGLGAGLRESVWFFIGGGRRAGVRYGWVTRQWFQRGQPLIGGVLWGCFLQGC